MIYILDIDSREDKETVKCNNEVPDIIDILYELMEEENDNWYSC